MLNAFSIGFRSSHFEAWVLFFSPGYWLIQAGAKLPSGVMVAASGTPDAATGATR